MSGSTDTIELVACQCWSNSSTSDSIVPCPWPLERIASVDSNMAGQQQHEGHSQERNNMTLGNTSTQMVDYVTIGIAFVSGGYLAKINSSLDQVYIDHRHLYRDITI